MRASSKPFFVDIADSKTNENEQCHKDKPTRTVLVAGATGYIGRAVVSECVQQGYNTVALVRNATYITSTADGRARYADSFQGAQLVEADVEDAAALTSLIAQVADESGKPVESIISCLASPTGTRREAYAIDYQATLNCLQAGRDERVQAKHFVLLSAFCCRNPLLQLQQAKLKFESEMAAQSDMTWTSVRPTAFFKSVSGQLEAIRGGAPYVLFGDGAVTQCNPIAESELAEYMVNTITDTSKHGKILNIGGPDEPLTNQMLGNMMYQSLGMEPKFVYAPTSLFDPIINMLQWIADRTGEEKWQDAAETARIGKYYAVVDMLTTDPSEKYGTITMQEHYNKIAAEGQDKFTPVRATAVIGRWIESFPLITAAHIPLFGYLSNPKAVQTMAETSGLNLGFILASTHNIVI